MDGVKALKQLIDDSSAIVFFGGAGVSTESGIPDFRSEGGVFDAIRDFGYPPETLLSRDFFDRHTDVFYEYYKNNLLCPGSEPNPAHKALAKLEEQGRLTAVVTQNIDGLHQKAGSKKVLELHGSTARNHCLRCGRAFDTDYVMSAAGVPKCDRCGGVIKPDVVLYGECLPEDVMAEAARAIRRADMLIVGGTSLAVYPAAGFVSYYRGSCLVLINKSATPLDAEAGLVLHEPIGSVLGACLDIS